jgi:hypothetical protein
MAAYLNDLTLTYIVAILPVIPSTADTPPDA